MGVLVAASGSATGLPDWVAALVGTGLTPIVVFGMIQAKALYTGGNHREILDAITQRCADAEKRADRAEDENNRYRDTYENRVLPALIDGTQAQRETLAYLLGRKAS